MLHPMHLERIHLLPHPRIPESHYRFLPVDKLSSIQKKGQTTDFAKRATATLLEVQQRGLCCSPVMVAGMLRFAMGNVFMNKTIHSSR